MDGLMDGLMDGRNYTVDQESTPQSGSMCQIMSRGTLQTTIPRYVRSITQKVSGFMAATVHEACNDHGCEVWHLHSPLLTSQGTVTAPTVRNRSRPRTRTRWEYRCWCGRRTPVASCPLSRCNGGRDLSIMQMIWVLKIHRVNTAMWVLNWLIKDKFSLIVLYLVKLILTKTPNGLIYKEKRNFGAFRFIMD